MKKWILLFALCGCLVMPGAAAEMEVSAKSAALYVPETGQMLYEKAADARMPMASVTKMMTAICAIELADPETVVTVSDTAALAEGSSMYLKPGEQLPMEELLKGLMLVSGNDAAAAVAEGTSGSVSAFVEQMNQKAALLGLQNTHFRNPSGLPEEGHYSSARDLAVLAAYSLENPRFAELVSMQSATVAATNAYGVRYLTNHNKLLRNYEGAIGVKTGFTKAAGRCLVSAAERDGVRLVAVTLSDPDDWNDHARMLDAGFSRVKRLEQDEFARLAARTAAVVGGSSSSVPLLCEGDPPLVVDGRYSASVELPHFLYAPVKEGEQVGMLTVCSGEKRYTYALRAAVSVPYREKEKSLWGRICALWHSVGGTK